MGVNLVIRTIAALLAIGLGTYVALPIMFNMKGSLDWTNVPDEGLLVRDGIYTVFLMMAVPLLALVFIWSHIASGRKSGTESW